MTKSATLFFSHLYTYTTLQQHFHISTVLFTNLDIFCVLIFFVLDYCDLRHCYHDYDCCITYYSTHV